MAITEIIRLMHPRRYVPRKRRFARAAFSNSSGGGGVSVLSSECVDRKGHGICAHIRKYYDERIAGSPPVFWRIPVANLPNGHSLEQQTTPSGDDCHYNIMGINDAQCYELLKSVQPTDYQICAADGLRTITEDELKAASDP